MVAPIGGASEDVSSEYRRGGVPLTRATGPVPRRCVTGSGSCSAAAAIGSGRREPRGGVGASCTHSVSAGIVVRGAGGASGRGALSEPPGGSEGSPGGHWDARRRMVDGSSARGGGAGSGNGEMPGIVSVIERRSRAGGMVLRSGGRRGGRVLGRGGALGGRMRGECRRASSIGMGARSGMGRGGRCGNGGGLRPLMRPGGGFFGGSGGPPTEEMRLRIGRSGASWSSRVRRGESNGGGMMVCFGRRAPPMGTMVELPLTWLSSLRLSSLPLAMRVYLHDVCPGRELDVLRRDLVSRRTAGGRRGREMATLMG